MLYGASKSLTGLRERWNVATSDGYTHGLMEADAAGHWHWFPRVGEGVGYRLTEAVTVFLRHLNHNRMDSDHTMELDLHNDGLCGPLLVNGKRVL